MKGGVDFTVVSNLPCLEQLLHREYIITFTRFSRTRQSLLQILVKTKAVGMEVWACFHGLLLQLLLVP
uniref:Uncharacterized protein n=1 Tax=Cannabis sativa TaxID=3483 RepID=A0A803QVX8_CANSA